MNWSTANAFGSVSLDSNQNQNLSDRQTGPNNKRNKDLTTKNNKDYIRQLE
jgi:hypothetical protein